jgi:hypothetical protein
VSATPRKRPAAPARRAGGLRGGRLGLLDGALWAAAGGTAFATLIGWAAPLWWGFALFEHFRLQYAVGAVAIAIVAASSCSS